MRDISENIISDPLPPPRRLNNPLAGAVTPGAPAVCAMEGTPEECGPFASESEILQESACVIKTPAYE